MKYKTKDDAEIAMIEYTGKLPASLEHHTFRIGNVFYVRTRSCQRVNWFDVIFEYETETEKQMEKIYSSRYEALGAALQFIKTNIRRDLWWSIIEDGAVICLHVERDGVDESVRKFKYHELHVGYVYAVRNIDGDNYAYRVFNGNYSNDGTPKFSVRSDGKAPDTWAEYKPTGIKAE